MNSQPLAGFSRYVLRPRLFPAPHRKDPILWILAVYSLAAAGAVAYYLIPRLQGGLPTLLVLVPTLLVWAFTVLAPVWVLRSLYRWRDERPDELSQSIVAGGRGLRSDGPAPEPAAQSWDSYMEIFHLLDDETEDGEEAESETPVAAEPEQEIRSAASVQQNAVVEDLPALRPAPELWRLNVDQHSVRFGEPVRVRWVALNADYVEVEGVSDRLPIEGTVELVLQQAQALTVTAVGAGRTSAQTPFIDVVTAERIATVDIAAPTLSIPEFVMDLPSYTAPAPTPPVTAPRMGRLLQVMAPPAQIERILSQIERILSQIRTRKVEQASDTLTQQAPAGPPHPRSTQTQDEE